MTRYDFLDSRLMILNNVWTDFWQIFCCQKANYEWRSYQAERPLVMWSGENNDQIWLIRGETSDFEQCSNRIQLDLILLFVNFAYELLQIHVVTRNDFPEARRVIFSNVRTDSNLT